MIWVLIAGFVIIIYLDIYSIKQTQKFFDDIGLAMAGDNAEVCSTAGVDAADIDAYLDDFDTNWDQYDIEPMKYYLFVPALEEDIGLPDGKNVVYIWKNNK